MTTKTNTIADLWDAAPELYIALEDMSTMFLGMADGDTTTETGWKNDEQLAVWLRAKAALAKAKGEAA